MKEKDKEWTRFSFPLHYHKDIMPEYALVILTSSNGLTAVEGSEAWFDDLEFIYNNGTGFIEKDADELVVYNFDNILSVFLNTNQNDDFSLSVYNMLGKLVMENSGLSGQKNIYNLNLPGGTYIVSVRYNGKILTKKIVL